MADDAADPNVAPPAAEDPAKREVSIAKPEPDAHRVRNVGVLRGGLSVRRTIGLGLAFLAPCVVIALSVRSIVRDRADRSAIVNAPGSVEASRDAEPPPAAPALVASASPALDAGEASSPTFYNETDDGEPSPAKPRAPEHFATVQQAALGSCSTASVEGLSRQIIAQARCIRPNAFVALPTRSNLVMGPHVFPYLELDARNHLVRVLDANPTRKMTINSALRTVAQQYLVWRWGAGKRCGVQLATPPGESNHEIGVALDIAEPSQWRTALEGQKFRWLGASDRVHFDFKGSEPPRSATDVLAFQTLWNRNHPRDAIAADGRYTPVTEQRLKKAPPDGFPIGPSCGKGVVPKR